MKETDLCDAFAARARESGWVVYPETGGWDLLLVASAVHDTDPETQVGVSAKLRPSVEVIAQAMPPQYLYDMGGDPIPETGTVRGPDFRAVLVPRSPHPFTTVCRALRVHVYTQSDTIPTWARKVERPPLHMRRSAKRVSLPPIVPSWSGGSPSPKTLSGWRINALRLCTVLRSRGFITAADFKEHKIDRSRWVSTGWVRNEGAHGDARYVLGPAAHDLPDVGYEVERDALAAIRFTE